MATGIWDELGFKKNPFKIVPDTESNDLVWAGFHSNKVDFERFIKDSLTSEDSKVLLNLSKYGGGKTHTAYYFAKHSGQYVSAGGVPPVHYITTTPRTGETAAWDFFVKLIEVISLGTIIKALKGYRASVGQEQALTELQRIAKSEDMGRLVWLLADDDDDIAYLAGEVIMSGKATVPVRRKLRLRRGPDMNSDASLILSCIIGRLALYSDAEKLPTPRRVFVWIDELESLIYYTSRQYRPFTQGLREIVDSTPKHLTLIMNFSFAAPSEAENLEIVIGEALLQRVTDRIVFEDGSLTESLQYIKDLLTYYRKENNTAPDLFPFTADAAVKLLEIAPEKTGKPRTPRSINQWCLKAIDAASRQGAITGTGITSAFISNLHMEPGDEDDRPTSIS